jgi:hypothetical protein
MDSVGMVVGKERNSVKVWPLVVYAWYGTSGIREGFRKEQNSCLERWVQLE